MTSHKPLKSVSHNFGHSFISLMNYINDDYFMGHLLKQACKTKCNKLTVDILKNIAEPTDLLTDQIKSSIEHWNKWFPTLVENSGSTMDFVSSATMTIEFDLQQLRPYAGNSDYFESPFTCEIVIIDDRNKEYKHKHEGWWFPETK
jgi:ABC-type bacteriocin/lantibiotic exporter with double-glycine peptidase domain